MDPQKLDLNGLSDVRDGAESNGAASTELNAFLEAFRKSLTHDLRTPLGTIVNYAAMLENHEGPRSEEVRDFGRRIRQKAMQTAVMLHHLSTAARLAGRHAACVSNEIPLLLEKSLAEAGGCGAVRAHGCGGTERLAIDPELLVYLWRTFLELEAQTSATPLRHAELSLDMDGRAAVLELCVGERAGSAPKTPVELATFLREAGEKVRQESALAIRLASDLVRVNGGAVEFIGRAGAGSALRIRLRQRS